ncbi:hypothetical protein R1flu_024414 [Riccia fluitans]|uniref:F-box domain-containing protein n=1 Tax=Riccia fluitans TaxID=41844 RepID=A0ABD1XUU7_9MARC
MNRSSSTKTEITQQGSVWDRLHKDLVMTVLAHLPEPACLRARAVCKYWQRLIDSEEFAAVCGKVWPKMARPSWFLFYQGMKVETVFVYDPGDESHIYRLPLTFLPVKKLQGVCGRAAAGSLLCVEERAKGFFKALYLCDPLEKTWVKLPPMTIQQQPGENLDPMRSVILTTAEEEKVSGSYKVFVSSHNRTQVFDSNCSSWQSLGPAPAVRSSSLMSSVWCDNSLFTLSPPPGFEIVPQRYQLLKFNLDDPGTGWRPVHVEMPKFLKSPHLAVHRGRIIMVGKVYSRLSSHGPSCHPRMKIWELNENTASWDLVDHVPESMHAELISGNWNSACAWNDEWICIACKDRVLSYNLRTKRWGKSPQTSMPGSTSSSRSSDPDRPSLSLISSFKPTFRKRCLLSPKFGE